MNRADKMLSVLADGRAHSRADIFDRVGFMLTNNAASELRARGHNVEHTRQGDLDVYRLLGEAAAPDAYDAASLSGPTPPSQAGPLSLFAHPRGAYDEPEAA